MPTQDLNRIAETAEAARRVGEKAKADLGQNAMP